MFCCFTFVLWVCKLKLLLTVKAFAVSLTLTLTVTLEKFLNICER